MGVPLLAKGIEGPVPFWKLWNALLNWGNSRGSHARPKTSSLVPSFISLAESGFHASRPSPVEIANRVGMRHSQKSHPRQGGQTTSSLQSAFLPFSIVLAPNLPMHFTERRRRLQLPQSQSIGYTES